MKYYLLNKLTSNGEKPKLNEGETLVDIEDFKLQGFFDDLKEDDEVVIIGGDSTLNRFINDMKGYEIKNNVYLLGSSSGNDFFNDIEHKGGDEVFLNPYLKNLPRIKVNGMERLCINNIGIGIDGYCCEKAEKKKKKNPNKKVNYTAIAIFGTLFHYRPCEAWVTVDGKKYEYDHVWMASSMKGRYFGGGMKMAPNQDRYSNKLTLVIYMARTKMKGLSAFPEIFTGSHVLRTNMVRVFTGNKITVDFSRACTVEIDGEIIPNVKHYEVEL